MCILIFNELTNDELNTVINSCEIFNACASIDDQHTVHKVSQQVPGIKIKLHPIPISKHIDIFMEIPRKKFNIVLSMVKKLE